MLAVRGSRSLPTSYTLYHINLYTLYPTLYTHVQNLPSIRSSCSWSWSCSRSHMPAVSLNGAECHPPGSAPHCAPLHEAGHMPEASSSPLRTSRDCGKGRVPGPWVCAHRGEGRPRRRGRRRCGSPQCHDGALRLREALAYLVQLQGARLVVRALPCQNAQGLAIQKRPPRPCGLGGRHTPCDRHLPAPHEH